MITVLLDNDISGHQELFTGTVYSTGWAESHLVRFITLIEAGLTNDALDRDIWRYCQSHSFLLLTANRNQDDPDSLEQTLRHENRENALPVVTISAPQRLIEPVYRERCIHALIGIILERVMHIERSARCMDVEMKRHPGERREPDPGGRLDSRVRGNDHYSYERCLLTLQST